MFKKLYYTLPLVVLIISLTIISAGCTSNVEPLQTVPDFIGFITDIHPGGSDGVTGQLTVESHADKLVARYVITIKNETAIFKQDGENLSKVKLSAFQNQQWVEIWFTGPVLESWPMQATALQIEINQ